MKKTEKTITEKVNRYIDDVVKTKIYGSCYIPVWNRDPVVDPKTGVKYYWKQYGRSFLGGGHKYKAYALAPEN